MATDGNDEDFWLFGYGHVLLFAKQELVTDFRDGVEVSFGNHHRILVTEIHSTDEGFH